MILTLLNFKHFVYRIFYIHIKEISLHLDVDPSDYMNSPVDYLTLSIYAVVQVHETGQSWTGEDRFVLEKPDLTITV